MSVSDDDLDRYRPALRHRDEEARVWQEETRRRAWDDARRAASMLNEEFGAERVLLFGSVAREERLSPHSDLDLAVEGLAPMEYYRAVNDSSVLCRDASRLLQNVCHGAPRPSILDPLQRFSPVVPCLLSSYPVPVA